MKNSTPRSRELKQKKLLLLQERARRLRWQPLHRKSCDLKDPLGSCGCPQALAYNSDADVIGYGGAAGGGKSDLEVATALLKHHRAAIFRRTSKEARDLYERAKSIAGVTWSSNDTEKILRGPQGQLIEFAGLEHPNDVQKWRGRPHDFLGFDEVTEFLEMQVRFVGGWLRTTRPGQRCQQILTFNPPSTVEGRWVIRYFAPWIDKNYRGERAMPGELRWFAAIDGKEIEVESGKPFEHNGRPIVPVSRTFIPASLRDNPILQATEYGRQLDALPEPLRSQLLYGDFDAGIVDDDWQVIPSAWIEAAFERYRNGKRPDVPLTAVGIDVARGGKDSSVYAPRYINWFDPLIKVPGKDTPDGFAIAGDIATFSNNIIEDSDGEKFSHRFADSTEIHIDIIGVGGSPADILSNNGFRVVPINGSASSHAIAFGRLGFVNVRSEIYWNFREALDPVKGHELAIAPNDALREELAAHRWQQQSGRIKVLGKDEVKEIIGRSPDEADAIVYAHAEVSSPGVNQLEALRRLTAPRTEN
jgi:hypothetical protein